MFLHATANRLRTLTLATLAVAGLSSAADAVSVSVLHAFDPGIAPQDVRGLVKFQGNFYGASRFGALSASGGFPVNGTCFKVTPEGVTTVLHSFTDDEGNDAVGTLAIGPDGNFYGVTNNSVFRMSPAGSFTVIHTFDHNTEGYLPAAGLMLRSDGNFYGVTGSGGSSGWGTVFKITSDGTLTVVHNFAKVTDGYEPSAPLVEDSSGNLYGVDLFGGTNGNGTLFKMDSTNAFSVVHTFARANEGDQPVGLMMASDGNLYGTTGDGGSYGRGTIFRCTPGGTVTSFYSFGAGEYLDDTPTGNLVEATPGNLYGTYFGADAGPNVHGGVFKLTTAGAFTSVYDFGPNDLWYPAGGVTVGDDGALYGPSNEANAVTGGIFKVTTGGAYSTVATFTMADGRSPVGGVTKSTADGSLYGATLAGGSADRGTIFKIDPSSNYSNLHAFTNTEGVYPQSGLLENPTGTFTGILNSGAGNNQGGEIYTINTSGNVSDISAMGGYSPLANVITASDGNEYTVANYGGGNGHGAVYRIYGGTVTDICDLPITADGAKNTLVDGGDGYLYGVVHDGGGNLGDGAVYRVSTAGVYSMLYTFDTSNGYQPQSLMLGGDGNLYGTCRVGGASGYGAAFRISRSSPFNLTFLHAFQNTDGSGPQSLIQLPTGTFLGTCSLGGASNYGDIFTMTPAGDVTDIYDFDGVTGIDPNDSPLCRLDPVTFAGTTWDGGVHGLGTVYQLSLLDPPATVTAGGHAKSVSVTWSASPGATSYNVYRGTAAGTESTTPTATGLTSCSFTDANLQTGTTYYYKVAAVNAIGTSHRSAEAHATTLASATFVKVDTTTQGNWRDAYGSDGYNVIGDPSTNNPHYRDYVSATPGTHNSGVWAASSLSPACLQTATAGSPLRLAGIWFQTSWTLNVKTTGPRQLALYLLDQPNAGYAETITVKDAVTGSVLDTRQASNFGAGAYYVWNVTGDVNITFTSTAGQWAVLSGIFFGGAPGSHEPSTPTGVTVAPSGGGLKVTWTASSGATSYNVYRGTTVGGESTTPIATGVKTTSYTNTGLTPNTTYYYKVVAVNAVAGSFASAEASGTAPPPSSSAVFVKADTSTQGSWKGVYGADGWNVIGDVSSNNPTNAGYATVTAGTHNSGVWAATSTNPACLQKSAVDSTDRMAGVWFQTTWSMNVNVTGTHQLALYFLDLNNAGYAETVTIKDAATGAVLDSRPVSSFTGGVYEVWTVSGNVTITFAPTAGKWAVVNGIFFG